MKSYFPFILALIISAASIAQNGINYKAIIKDANGGVIANQAITIQFQILEDGTTNVYQESHNPTTDASGIIVVNIGEGTVNSGDFLTIDWGADDHFLNVKVDSNTGAGLVDLGTTQFKSVPYALVAENVKNAPFKMVGNVVQHTEESDFLFGTPSQDYTSGIEKKIFFNSATGAFRGGIVLSDAWDAINLGEESFAYGKNNKVSNDGGVAFGGFNDISGRSSFAHGGGNIISGNNSVAFGSENIITGFSNFTNGLFNYSTHDYNTLIGNFLVSGRDYQTTFGTYNEASTTAVFQLGDGLDNASRNTLFSIEDDGAIMSEFYEGTEERLIATDANGKLIPTTITLPSPSSGLEKITENGNSGYRIVGKDPALYGNIGNEAIDLSYNATVSPFYGARGDYAFAAGFEARASGENSVSFSGSATGENSIAIGSNSIASRESAVGMGGGKAFGAYSFAVGTSATTNAAYSTTFGRHNTGQGDIVNWVSTDPLFEIGNGTSENAKSNALTVLKNGTITAPSFDISEITNNKALITKEYFDANNIHTVASTGLEQITEDGNTGYRLVGKNPTRYGNIGVEAVDLSYSPVTSTLNGALGNYSFASGYSARAGGHNSFSFAGYASGENSVSIGNNSVASGQSTVGIGDTARAFGQNSIALGKDAQATGVNAIAIGLGSTAATNAVSLGGANANAANSFAVGEFTVSGAAYNTAIGRYNIGSGNVINWVSTDRLFEIGNGTSENAKSNAFTVLKNGRVGIGKHSGMDAMLEIESNSTATQPQLALIENNSSFARLRFKNTNRSGDDYWDIAGFIGTTQADDRLNFFNNGVGNLMSLDGTGKLGLQGDADTDLHLHHEIGAAGGFKLENRNSNNWFRFYVSSTSGDLRLYSTSQGATPIGNFNDISGAYTATSDKRLKKNFKNLRFNWSDFMQLEALNYQYKAQKDNKTHLGFVAQDVEAIYPELVSYQQEEDVYHLNYSGFGVVAVKAVQELKKEVSALASENLKLKEQLSKYENLEARLSAIENGSNNFGNINNINISAEKE